MDTSTHTADVNIHLRARPQDRDLIDQAAELSGSNRSQFMLSSALNAARNIVLDQTSLALNHQKFQHVLEWMDAPASEVERAGMERLVQTPPRW